MKDVKNRHYHGDPMNRPPISNDYDIFGTIGVGRMLNDGFDPQYDVPGFGPEEAQPTDEYCTRKDVRRAVYLDDPDINQGNPLMINLVNFL